MGARGCARARAGGHVRVGGCQCAGACGCVRVRGWVCVRVGVRACVREALSLLHVHEVFGRHSSDKLLAVLTRSSHSHACGIVLTDRRGTLLRAVRAFTSAAEACLAPPLHLRKVLVPGEPAPRNNMLSSAYKCTLLLHVAWLCRMRARAQTQARPGGGR